jgi:hypothetical protein
LEGATQVTIEVETLKIPSTYMPISHSKGVKVEEQLCSKKLMAGKKSNRRAKS